MKGLDKLKKSKDKKEILLIDKDNISINPNIEEIRKRRRKRRPKRTNNISNNILVAIQKFDKHQEYYAREYIKTYGLGKVKPTKHFTEVSNYCRTCVHSIVSVRHCSVDKKKLKPNLNYCSKKFTISTWQ